MNEEKIEEIKNAVRELIQLLIQRGKPLSSELKAQVFKVLEYAQKRIEQLRAGTTGGGDIPTAAPAEHPSSNIYGFNFDPKSQKLLIKFMGKDTAESGPVYQYDGVPPHIFDVIRRGAVAPKTTGRNKYHAWYRGKTPSHGASVYALIKQAEYPYKKVA